MRLRITTAIAAAALYSSCGGGEASGAWKSPDASFYFYEWDGGAFWGMNELFLAALYIQLADTCADFDVRDGRLASRRPHRPVTPLGPSIGPMVAARLELDDSTIDSSYRLRHERRQDAGSLVGLVKMSFDAGFHFQTDDRGAFRWQAEYYDDERSLGGEGGEVWFDRASGDCR